MRMLPFALKSVWNENRLDDRIAPVRFAYGLFRFAYRDLDPTLGDGIDVVPTGVGLPGAQIHGVFFYFFPLAAGVLYTVPKRRMTSEDPPSAVQLSHLWTVEVRRQPVAEIVHKSISIAS